MAYKVEAETVIYVNDKQAQEKIKKLEARAEGLRRKFADAKLKDDPEETAKISKSLQRVTAQLSTLRTREQNVHDALVRMDKAAPRSLLKVVRDLTAELNSGRIARGSKEWDTYVAKLKEAKKELKELRAEMSVEDSDDSSFLSKIKDGINNWGASAAVAMGAFAGITMAGKEAVQAYADMQAEEANVRKFTGMTEEEVNKLNDAFKKMDTRTSREELNKLAQEAGRLGKNNIEDVLGFVKAADQINVALDDLGEGATLTLSKLTGIFGDEKIYGTEQSLLKVGSVINELSQNCSASAPYLAEFSSRLGGIAAQSKMNISQVMAFAAVLDTQNLNLEASATAVGQLITSIYQEPAKIAKAAGMDVEKFSKQVKTDMNGALIALFEQLQKFGGMENLASVFDQMGTDGARAIPVLTALSGHVEELKSQQLAANVAFQEGTSVTKEFEVQNNTVQAGLDKAKKGFTEIAVSLGEKLVPVMSMCISGTSMLMRTLNTLIEFVAKHPATIMMLVTTLAAYTTAVKFATIQQGAFNMATKVGNAVMAAWRTGAAMCKVTIALFTKGLNAAKLANDEFTRSAKKSVWGWIVVAVGAAITAFISWLESMEDAEEQLKKQQQEAEEFKKKISDLNEGANQYAKDELGRVKVLYQTATDDSKSKKLRIEAANELLKTYPKMFEKYSAELIILGKAKTAYDNLTDSIMQNAMARAAQDKINENASLIFQYEESTIPELQRAVDKAKQEEAKILAELEDAKKKEIQWQKARKFSSSDDSTDPSLAITNAIERRLKEAQKVRKEAVAAVKKAQEERDLTRSATDKLIQKYGTTSKEEEKIPTFEVPEVGETDKERREREKREREARKAAKDALKKDLDEQAALLAQAEARNLESYLMGQKDYLQFLNTKESLEKDNVEKVLKIHEKHNKIDVVAYSNALRQKAELQKKHLDNERTMFLSVLQEEHDDRQNAITSSYFNPTSEMFQDDKMLKQLLFQEDVRFLKKKAALYLKGSKERAEVERQLEELIAKDKMDKEQELARAYMEFEQKYRKASGSRREKMELEMMDELHKKGLISEEEYQRACRDIKDKYLKEDAEKRKSVQSEYGDMAVNIYKAFKKLFDALENGSEDLLGKISNAATAAFALMAAGLQQYSSYANAERDLELAKVEDRYDREIKAAGKNEKKKAALEKKKEAEVASIKKKHNDKAMKIEIAQAVAQTALAAINAYASASKVNWLLGPIAAAMATAAGMIQIATIKKQHEAQAIGYYSGGFTQRDSDNHREVGVVHANEFVANHRAVANPALSPVLRLIDYAQRNNTVGSLSRADVSRAIGNSPGVGAGGTATYSPDYVDALAGGYAVMTQVSSETRDAINRLSDRLDAGIEVFAVLDGERGFHRKYEHFKKLINNPSR